MYFVMIISLVVFDVTRVSLLYAHDPVPGVTMTWTCSIVIEGSRYGLGAVEGRLRLALHPSFLELSWSRRSPVPTASSIRSRLSSIDPDRGKCATHSLLGTSSQVDSRKQPAAAII
jgi:hypothetical protein